MEHISIAVGLKAYDPTAVTALAALRRTMPDHCPELLHRFECWTFIVEKDGRQTVRDIVSRYDDIVNPNKQFWSFIDGSLPGEDACLVWSGALVTDREDSVAENWTRILRRSGFQVVKVVYSILWRFGFPTGTPFEKARESTIAAAFTTHRDSGLLGNPVSQVIDITGPG